MVKWRNESRLEEENDDVIMLLAEAPTITTTTTQIPRKMKSLGLVETAATGIRHKEKWKEIG